MASVELNFTRDNSSYREQKASIRPLYPTLQTHHSNTNPFSPIPRHGLITPWITMGNLVPSLRTPAVGDPHDPLVIRTPAGVAPVARIALPESAAAVRCGR